jgi:hypothetical protein
MSCIVAAVLSACAASTVALDTPAAGASAALHCHARDRSLEWRASEPADAAELARWCRAVGAPIFLATTAAPAEPPALDELVVLSWNAHLAEGDLPELIDTLRAGRLTGGRPVTRFVLLVQELYRRGESVPQFDTRDRTAFAIVARDLESADVDDYAASLGLSILYVPSMRNGAELREDRGNAIVSTEPLVDPLAVELPLARQRRVTVGAAIQVRAKGGVQRLEVLNAHLEPLSSPHTLWVFKNPRPRQVRALLDVLESPRYTSPEVAGVVLGGDFNTVQGGDREEGYRHARAWSTSLAGEDRRRTHMMGRLDYLFFRLGGGWTAETRRLDDRFGSDHHPVLGTFRPDPGSPPSRPQPVPDNR